MGLLKKIFRKEAKPKESVVEKSAKQKDIKIQLDAVFKDKRNKVCKLCENTISDSDRYSKQGGYFWHKKCWIKTKKIAMKNHF